MSKGLRVVAAMVFAGFLTANAQIVVNELDTAAADSMFQLLGTGLGTPHAYCIVTDDPNNPFSGAAAMNCDWKVYTTESWGGFLQLMHTRPVSEGYYDFSTHKFLSLRFNNLIPSSVTGPVEMRFKLHEAGEGNAGTNGDWEDWYFQTPDVYNSPAGWTELLIPLKEIPNAVGSAPNDEGFSLPGWSGQTGNEKLDLNRIVGYSIEWTAVPIFPDSTASGNVSWDHLTLVQDRNTVFHKFDNAATDTHFVQAGTGASNIVVSDNTTNFVEGTASLQCNWTIEATEPWGGFVNYIYNADDFFGDISGNSHILLKYNNKIPASIPANTVMRVQLHDYSEGVQEVWYYENPPILESDSGWHDLLIPLVDRGYGPAPDNTGFSNPGWAGQPGNQQLDWDKIRGFSIDFVALTQGTTTTGTFLVDYMTGYGSRPTDTTPPNPVTLLQAVPGSYYNLVTWVDPPNEPKSRYNVYYSEMPITDVTAPGVEVAWLGVPYNTQNFAHLLFSPLGDSLYAYYYAVTVTDSVGNTSVVTATATPTTNTARGVATVSLNAPANFAADGDLSEWANVVPVRMFPSQGAHIVTNTTINGDDDLSVLAYVAADANYLYIAFDVTDDVVDTSAVNSWENDSPDLFIGLYNWHGAPHTGYQRGATPDYHFRFNHNRMIVDNLGGYILLQTSSPNYHWAAKPLLPGYIVEAKISWADIAASGGDQVFTPVEGMRIPWDYSINDRDGTGVRQGIMTLSPYNDDTSWQSPRFWVHTWIGERDEVLLGIDDTEDPLAYTYHLAQNYPNPFNPETTIRYNLAKASPVKLQIYNTLGQKVATLINENQAPGAHQVRFNGRNLPSGIYFYRIEAGDFVQVKKMVLMK